MTKSRFDQPFVDVPHTMLRMRDHPRAELVLDGPGVVGALADPELGP